MKPTSGVIGRPAKGTRKTCPRCQESKPLEAYRKDKNKPQGVDSYCKACRRIETQQNRPRENARWNAYRKREGVDASRARAKREPEKLKARYLARRAHPKPKKCSLRGCANRGVRHHYMPGYKLEDATKIMWVCPKHHALEHVLEKARRRTGPSWL